MVICIACEDVIPYNSIAIVDQLEGDPCTYTCRECAQRMYGPL